MLTLLRLHLLILRQHQFLATRLKRRASSEVLDDNLVPFLLHLLRAGLGDALGRCWGHAVVGGAAYGGLAHEQQALLVACRRLREASSEVQYTELSATIDANELAIMTHETTIKNHEATIRGCETQLGTTPVPMARRRSADVVVAACAVVSVTFV